MKKTFLPVLLSLLLLVCFAPSVFASNTIERWEQKNDFPVSRLYPHVAVANQTIYVIGGSSSGYTGFSNNVYAYNSSTDSWIEKAPMPTARYGAAIAVVNDLIYVIGGKDRNGYTAIVEVYNPKTDTWSSKAKLPATRTYTSGIAFNNKIYVIGGYNPSGSNSNTIYEYNTDTDSWIAKSNMPSARSGIGLAILNGKIYAIGGEEAGSSNSQTSKVEIYNPETDTWESGTPYPESAIYIGATELNGKIYGVGGGKPTGNIKINSVYEFDPAKNEWSKKLDMPTTRRSGVVSFNNAVYSIAGETTTASNKVEVYYPGVSDESTDPTNPTDPTDPEQSKGNRAILTITLTTGLEKEFDLSMDEVNSFISWYENKNGGKGTASYAINKHSNNKGPFTSRKDYVIFDKILTFEVSEYTAK
ncbi:hypothetical protein MH117_15355 [Paenibacillus sp. ACRRX]|uniref:Kelch repeat-containing protein n=1 Tax=Paenibacillus sp. ACRRX TaxID=2918206 RepID=UPI001EF4BB3B|nr:kelch repeat-containing protein [Paenibacillus sp. ACRRX]MCG7408807.1 hypothetical protein [Paenibacillus sp. ACRRX]